MAQPTNPIPRSSPFFKAPKGQATSAPPVEVKTESNPVIDALVESFGGALRRDFGGEKLPNHDGWVLASIAPRMFLRLGACATFQHGELTLCALVMPTDPANENPYFRTKGYDMAYFFENVPEDKRSGIWQEHRALLDGLAAWLAAWDGDAEESAT